MPDPIGAASARLFAAGIGPQDRLLALRFLGVLLAQADDDGRVLADPDDLVGLGILNGMDPTEVEHSRRWLETVGVLERESTGWFIRDYASIGEEVPPAEAMAAIGRVLGHRADRDVPVVVTLARDELPPDVTPVPEPSHPRFSRWTAAPVGVAAAVLLVALIVSGQLQLNLPGRTVGHSSQNAQQVNSESPAPSSSDAAAQGSGSAPGTAAGTTPSSAGSVPVIASPSAGPTQATVVCPLGGVLVVVERVEQSVDGSVPTATPRLSASLPPIVRTVVSGAVRNTSSAATNVAPFPVEVTFTNPSGAVTKTVTTVALSAPQTVASGSSLAWTVAVENPDRAPLPATAKAGSVTWRWQDQGLATACPHA